jgi:hypothetical protein
LITIATWLAHLGQVILSESEADMISLRPLAGSGACGTALCGGMPVLGPDHIADNCGEVTS